MRTCNHRCFASMLCFVFLASILTPGTLYSQAREGSLSGVVSDSSGAVIPGATITLKGSEGLGQSITSDGQGRYSFSGLAAGRYVMSVGAPGFTIASGLVVNVASGRAITRNVQLEIAVVEQQVEVLAGAVLDTEPLPPSMKFQSTLGLTNQRIVRARSKTRPIFYSLAVLSVAYRTTL